MDTNLRLLRIRQSISEAAERVGRNPDDIKLVAISKTHPIDKIEEVFEAGQVVFGESRVQEAEKKISRIKADVIWHLVGHLQRNKAKTAVGLFELIHSVDSIKLAQDISKRAQMISKVQDVLIQVQLADEKTKFGVSKSEALEMIPGVCKLPGISVKGLMTIPPFFRDPEKSRPYFSELREFSQQLIQGDQLNQAETLELSMGMSNDYEIAIEEGATIVRVGTALFGTRQEVSD